MSFGYDYNVCKIEVDYKEELMIEYICVELNF